MHKASRRNVVAVIQVRMGSTRFLGKALKEIAGTTLLDLVYSRVSRCQNIDSVMLATTLLKEDDVLEHWGLATGVQVFRGSRDDVLSRFLGAAEIARADVIVRITADDPLKDPLLIDQLVAQLLDNPHLQYASNTMRPSFPEGMDVEVFTIESLKRANTEAVLTSDREHVTPFLKRVIDKENLFELTSVKNYSDLRWTVDYDLDLQFMRAVFDHFSPNRNFGWMEVIKLVNNNDRIRTINENIAERNEGYLASLEKDVD